MAEIVNLRRAKKARAAAEADALAQQNRTRFGRTTAEKARDRLERQHEAARVNGARLDPPATELGADAK